MLGPWKRAHTQMQTETNGHTLARAHWRNRRVSYAFGHADTVNTDSLRDLRVLRPCANRGLHLCVGNSPGLRSNRSDPTDPMPAASIRSASVHRRINRLSGDTFDELSFPDLSLSRPRQYVIHEFSAIVRSLGIGQRS